MGCIRRQLISLGGLREYVFRSFDNLLSDSTFHLMSKVNWHQTKQNDKVVRARMIKQDALPFNGLRGCIFRSLINS